MSLPGWREVPLDALVALDQGWKAADPARAARLVTSVRRHGQLRALVVRQALDGRLVVVDGRRVLEAMRSLGHKVAVVLDLGPLDADTASRVALDLETRFETDYTAVAKVVVGLLRQGIPAESIAACGEFSVEQVRRFEALLAFDWSRFAPQPETGQATMDWGDLPPAETQPLLDPQPGVLETEIAATPVQAPTEEPDGQFGLGF